MQTYVLDKECRKQEILVFPSFIWTSGRIWNRAGGNGFQWHDPTFEWPLQRIFLDYILFTTDDTSWDGNLFAVMRIPDNMSMQVYEALIDVTSDFTMKQKFNEIYYWLNSGAVSFKNIRQCPSLQLSVSHNVPVWSWMFKMHSHTTKISKLPGRCTRHESTALHHHYKCSATCWQKETPPFLTLMQDKMKHDILCLRCYDNSD
jgi:hypothetical protein